MTDPHPLVAARRADTDRCRSRVLTALAEMTDDPQQISVSSVAARDTTYLGARYLRLMPRLGRRGEAVAAGTEVR